MTNVWQPKFQYMPHNEFNFDLRTECIRIAHGHFLFVFWPPSSAFCFVALILTLPAVFAELSKRKYLRHLFKIHSTHAICRFQKLQIVLHSFDPT